MPTQLTDQQRDTATTANPAGLTVEQLARLLGVEAEKIREHIAAGAPVGPDERINLVQYAAWLNKEMGRTDAD